MWVKKVFETSSNYEIGKVVSAQSKPFVNYSFSEITGEAVQTEYKGPLHRVGGG